MEVEDMEVEEVEGDTSFLLQNFICQSHVLAMVLLLVVEDIP